MHTEPVQAPAYPRKTRNRHELLHIVRSHETFTVRLSRVFAGMNGYILGGRVHAHITLSAGDRAFGGHLGPHTNVFTFVIFTLGVLSGDADLHRLDDETLR